MNLATLFNCHLLTENYVLLYADLKLFISVCWDRSSFVCFLVHRGSTDDIFVLQISSGVVWQSRDSKDSKLSRNTYYLLSYSLLLHSIKPPFKKIVLKPLIYLFNVMNHVI